MTIEDRVRQTLSEAASRIDVVESAAVSRPPHRQPRAAWAFAMGVCAVAALGLAVGLLPGGSGPTPQIPPPALDTSDSLALEWRPLEVLPTDYVMGPFAHASKRSLALASRYQGVAGDEARRVFVSDDGFSWSELESSGLPAVVTVDGLGGHAGGFVAWGLYAGEGYTVTTKDQPSNFPEPAVWTSADGADWQMTPLPTPPRSQALSDSVSYGVSSVAVDETGGVAVGIEFDESQPTVDGEQIVPSRQIMWESTRGGDWSLVDTSGMGDPTAVASGPAGAVVTILVEDTVTVWIREGASWREAAMVPTSDHSPELVANRVGYVLRTSTGVWFSADAREWTSVGAPFGSISAGLDSFVALGASRDGNLVSWSGDGIDWTIIGSEGEFGVEDMAWISYATATDNAVVIAGQTEGTGMFREGSEGYVAIGTRGALASSG